MKFINLVFLTTFITACTTTVRPKEIAEFNKTSVMIVNTEESHGGTGVIYKSGSHSYILTNRHVCGLLAEGGYVLGEDKYIVKAFKASKVHDICYVVVEDNLRVNTVLASDSPKLHSKAFISGHPSLYPHVVSEGHVSESFKIDIVVDTRECTKEEFAEDPMTCLFEGYPILEELEAQLVSALIAPGSSGSAVFNEEGEIIGLAFASNSRDLAYALVVPWEYVANFVHGESRSLRWTYPVKVKASEKTEKSKERGTTLPYSAKEGTGFYNIENWKKLFQYLQETKCKK